MAKKANSKGFFALDVHQFERIRQNGLGVEEAATYHCIRKRICCACRGRQYFAHDAQGKD